MLTLTAPSLSAPTGFVDGRMRNRGGGAPPGPVRPTGDGRRRAARRERRVGSRGVDARRRRPRRRARLRVGARRRPARVARTAARRARRRRAHVGRDGRAVERHRRRRARGGRRRRSTPWAARGPTRAIAPESDDASPAAAASRRGPRARWPRPRRPRRRRPRGGGGPRGRGSRRPSSTSRSTACWR